MKKFASLLRVSVALVSAISFSKINADDLAEHFANPPAEARPHTWWHWMNGNITREGITLDLEAMKRIGLGGAQIFNVAQSEPPGPVEFLSPEWRQLVKHALSEADRLGIELTIHNCAGWSESGGPWITPDLAMQKVVWSETRVHGPAQFRDKLPQPETIKDFYRDIAVFAIPAPTGDDLDASKFAPAITASVPDFHGEALLDGKNETAIELPLPAKDKPQFVQFEFSKPFTCASIRWDALAPNVPTAAQIQTSDDGKNFRAIGAMPSLGRRRGPLMWGTFPETTAKFFRVTITAADKKATKIALSALEFGPRRLSNIEEKSGYRPNAALAFPDEKFPASACVAFESIVDLSVKLSPDGTFAWDVPAGDWVIVRFGHTPTGQLNAPAPTSGRGLECDKMNRTAVAAHWEGMMAKVIADAGPLVGKSLKMALADSWEANCQNWTSAMREEFRKRRGYDLLPWLLTLTARPVADIERSERFLWDFRRTIADLIAENHYAFFQQLCREHGLQFTAEAPGIGMPTIADQLQCKNFTDVTMGEFWFDGHNDSKEAATAAHIFGKKIASAEAFTAKTEDAKWTKAPFDHKALGDLNFCRGINRFVFHRYAMQPWNDRAPGMTMGPWGTNFERTNTWWEPARAWMQYLTRCQTLLQSGLPVADVLYFYGEGAPVTITGREPKLPAGFDFDACDAGALLSRVNVKDGRLALPDGVNYRVLLLPTSDRMTPAVLNKIQQLVEAGATVIGPKPRFSPSLADFPKCDDDVKKTAAKLWGNDESGDRKVGAGRVVWGAPVAEVLTRLKMEPDFSCDAKETAFIHRRAGGADIYFVSSQSRAAAQMKCTFRVSGKIPEIWHSDTGEMERVPYFSTEGGNTVLNIRFDPAGSAFVVFREPMQNFDGVVSVTREGTDATSSCKVLEKKGALILSADEPGQYELRTASGRLVSALVPANPESIEVSGQWQLRFPPNLGAPPEVVLDKLSRWNEHGDEGVRHFSGTATYVKDFDFNAANNTATARRFLDLGSVREVAEVKLNGRDLGILWKPPFRVEVTDALRRGKNHLEIHVTNLWPNRLIGDAALPENERHTWTTFQPYKAGDPLLDSGLIGPVKIETRLEVEAR